MANPRVEVEEGGGTSIRSAKRKVIAHAVFGAVGLVALGLLVRTVGAATLFGIVRASARWIPLLFAIDALRVVAEIIATLSLSKRVRRSVPFSEVVRVHLVGYAIAMNMPAGRTAAEAVKAAMLSRFIGVPEAAAVGAANQTTTLLAGALGALPAIAAGLLLTGFSPLTGALALFAVTATTGFVLVQIACRKRGLAGALLRRFSKVEEGTAAFHDALAQIPIVPWVATVAGLFHRALAVLQLGILLAILGGRSGVGAAILAQGVSAVGGSVGDLVPGQLGATDGAFALAAPYLGLALVDGIAISVLLHCVQALWAAIGWTIPFFWKAPAQRESSPGEPASAPSERV